MSLSTLIGAEALFEDAGTVSQGAIENDQDEEIDSYYSGIDLDNELDNLRGNSTVIRLPSNEPDSEEDGTTTTTDMLVLRLKEASAGVITTGTAEGYERYEHNSVPQSKVVLNL